MPETEIISTLLGVFVGLTLGLTGAGGALLAIPLLVFILNLSIYQAAPIALLAVLTGSFIGAVHGLRKGVVRYKAAMLIAAIGIILAPLGVILAHKASNQVLSVILIPILLYISLSTWRGAKQETKDKSHIAPPACAINPANSKLFWTAPCTIRLITTGAFAGFLSGFLGVGGGFVIVPSLNKVSNFNNQTTIATTLAAVTLIAMSGITSHLQTSAIDWYIAIPFTISVALSTLISSATLSNRVPRHLSKKGFALLCMAAAIYLSIKNLS
jgi:uncharacterized protein